jgi:hypothetical protein
MVKEAVNNDKLRDSQFKQVVKRSKEMEAKKEIPYF